MNHTFIEDIQMDITAEIKCIIKLLELLILISFFFFEGICFLNKLRAVSGLIRFIVYVALYHLIPDEKMKKEILK